jgi:hypothetical protein
MSKFFTGDGLGCLEIDDENKFSYESDILDMYRRAAARSAPLSKDFCASYAQGYGCAWSSLRSTRLRSCEPYPLR